MSDPYVGGIRSGLTTRLNARSSGAWGFVLAVFFLGVALLAVGLSIVQTLKGTTFSESRISAANVVATLATDFERAISDVDQTLHSMVRTLEEPYFEMAASHLHGPLLFGAQYHQSIIASLRVLDRYGEVRYSRELQSRGGIGDYLATIFHANARSDRAHVSQPLSDGAGRRILSVSRRYEVGGQFAGVVVADISLHFVEQALLAVNLAPNSILALVYGDERIAARLEDGVFSYGQLIRGSAVMSKIGSKRSGFIEDTSKIDGIHRVYAHAAIGTYPLRMFYGKSTQLIEEQFWSKAQWLVAVIVLMSAVLFVLALCLAREFRVRLDAETELERQVNFDALTKLANRRHFDAVLAEEWRRGARNSAPVSLLMADADYFKKYNDHYGHPLGDRLLQALAEQIGVTARRAGELAARFGGEEFVVLLPGLDTLAAFERAEDLRRRIELLGLEHRNHPSGIVTVSIGVASLVPEAKIGGPDDLVVCADLALYEAKESGRNRVATFDDPVAETKRLAA